MNTESKKAIGFVAILDIIFIVFLFLSGSFKGFLSTIFYPRKKFKVVIFNNHTILVVIFNNFCIPWLLFLSTLWLMFLSTVVEKK